MSRDFKTPITIDGHRVWYEENDGPSSGLDADLLDGHEWLEIEQSVEGRQPLHGFTFPYDVSLYYSEVTRTITLTPSVSSFSFWVFGTKIIKESVVISAPHPNVSGQYFFTFNGSGQLSVSSSPWELTDWTKIPVCVVYYNQTTGQGFANFELHRANRNIYAHKQSHFSIGTFIKNPASNFSLSGYTLGSGTNANVTFSVSSGTILDEDIEWTIDTLTDNGPYTVLHRTGITEWTWQTGLPVPYIYNSGTNKAQVNSASGGVYSLVDVPNGDYFNYYLFATTALDENKRLFLVPGQTYYGSRSLADEETFLDLNFATTAPLEEFAPLWKITLRHRTSYSSTGRSSIEAITKLQGTRASVSVSGAGTAHNALTGRSDPDCHPASAITNTPSGLITSLTVQDALNELDTLKAPLVPVSDNTTDLGTSLLAFRNIYAHELFLSESSLYLGTTKIIGTEGGTVEIKTDAGQNLLIRTDQGSLDIKTIGANANINLTANGASSAIQITSSNSTVTVNGIGISVYGDTTFYDDLTVNGNLFVKGTQTIIETTSMAISDNIAVLNSGETGSGVSLTLSGVQIDRGELTDWQIVFDETDDLLKVGPVGSLEIVATRNWATGNLAQLSHSHAISDVTGLQTALDGKASSSHVHSISDVTDLQTLLDSKSATTHNHDSVYLPLTGGTLSNSLTFSNSRIKYGNSLLVSGLVIDSTKWYRVLSIDNSYCPWVDLYIQIPFGHSVYRVRLAKGTGSNGMGWTAEVDCGGIYNYAYGNIIQVRVVDMGPNAATYVDVKFNGGATRDIRLSIVNELSNHVGNYATLIACTDQGTAETGVVSNLGFYDHATIIGVSKSWLGGWGVISIQNSSTTVSHRYQVGTTDGFISLSSGGLNISTRSNSPLTFYSNQLNITTKRMDISGGTSTALTLYGNASSDNITMAFAKVGIASTYSQKIKFQYSSIRHSVTDSLIPNAINNGLAIGYDDGSTISNALMVGNGQVTVNGPEITSGYVFQVNGNTWIDGLHVAKRYSFYGIGSDSGNALSDYGIYQAGGAWSSPYPDLCIAYHTGIRIGAASNYGGTRFYANSFANGGGSEPYLMGVGDGALDIYFPTTIRFGSRMTQHINLYSTTYGIGVQSGTLYFRTGAGYNFSFHSGGTHSDTLGDPGAGGTELIRINTNGIYNSSWFRSTGQTGWYNETYGGGIYMTDTTWVRTYNSKGLAGYYLNGTTLAGTGNRAVYSDANGTLTNTASDERLKKDIKPLTYGLNEVLNLNSVFYRWKDEKKMGRQTEIGLIAQQVSKICPEVIGTNNDGMLSLDYSKLIAVLINAIKELKGEIDELSRIRSDRNKV